MHEQLKPDLGTEKFFQNAGRPGFDGDGESGVLRRLQPMNCVEKNVGATGGYCRHEMAVYRCCSPLRSPSVCGTLECIPRADQQLSLQPRECIFLLLYLFHDRRLNERV